MTANRLLTPPMEKRETVTRLVADVADGAKELVAAHGAQLRTEMKDQVLRAESVVMQLSFAGSMIFIGVAFLLVAVVMVLQSYFGWSAQASWGCVGGVVLLIGVITTQLARSELRSLHLIPDRTIHSFQESLQWITKR